MFVEGSIKVVHVRILIKCLQCVTVVASFFIILDNEQGDGTNDPRVYHDVDEHIGHSPNLFLRIHRREVPIPYCCEGDHRPVEGRNISFKVIQVNNFVS